MTTKQILLAALGLALVAVGLSACGGDTITLDQRADKFNGGALSNFSGTDGADPDARAIARDIASSRTFDFTLSGFNLADGPAQSTGAGGSGFGAGAGTIALSGDTATVGLDITSTNPNVDNAHMEGTFNAIEAGAAIANPGSSFVVDWTITFDLVGIPVSLDAQQTLNGTDFTTL